MDIKGENDFGFHESFVLVNWAKLSVEHSSSKNRGFFVNTPMCLFLQLSPRDACVLMA